MPDPIDFEADLTAPCKPLRHPWRWCVGSGHATLALRADWQRQLTRARRELGFRYVRFHGILDDDMGTLVCMNDQPLYSFFNADSIVDFLLSIGMKPVVELSFMPRMLASGNDIVFHYQGNVTPPRDLVAWSELIRRLVRHWVDRYGIDEVAQWPFECWNEPNLKAFWTGDQAGYFALYRATALAIKGVDGRLRVGGPASSGNAWLDDFTGWCHREQVPFDFLSTHFYPTDPFGAIDTDTVTQLEHSPPGVMLARATEARAAAGAVPLYYTEWSISSNPRDPMHDSSFAAAFATRILMSVDPVVDGYSYWTFSDIFEENYFPSLPFHGGFGLLNLYGIPKPVYRALQMVASLGDSQAPVTGSHETVAMWAGADAGGSTGTRIVVVNQALPRHPVATQSLRIRVVHGGDRRATKVRLRRIDEDHANPVKAWQAMGAPDSLTPDQVAALESASAPAEEEAQFQATAIGSTLIEVQVAPQSVNRIDIDWAPRA